MLQSIWCHLSKYVHHITFSIIIIVVISIIFVVVDLINRLDKCEVSGQEERVLYAQMNEKAGKKALSLPDFNSAARYTESAVLFLDESYWSTHHDLMLSIYETSAAALYSCGSNGNQDVLRDRVAKVLQHAKLARETMRCIDVTWSRH